MLYIADLFRQALVPFLAVTGALLALMLLVLVIQRAWREWQFQRLERLKRLYRPLLEGALGDQADTAARRRLLESPARHRHVIAGLLLARLRVVTGPTVTACRELARELRLVPAWTNDLRDARWWMRAEAVRALGLVAEPMALEALLTALDDEHEEVRAAATEALGRLGDPAAITALVERVADESRYQRARLIDALARLGPGVTPHVLRRLPAAPGPLASVIDLLGMLRAAEAMDAVVGWTRHASADVRAAALRALASIGVDDRSFYYALQALDDDDPGVRMMAARALGQSGRGDAASYLASHLDDEWDVAAQSAMALRDLGRSGRPYLQLAAGHDGQSGELARQMLWEAALRGPVEVSSHA